MFNKNKFGCFVHEQDSISSIIVFCSIKKSIGHKNLKIIIAQNGQQRTNYQRLRSLLLLCLHIITYDIQQDVI